MGLRLADGPWLSMVTGWRRNQVTYVDLQMNDMHYKKESLSAVMRAFLLEYEIGLKQEMINFVAGSSLLLRRYCEPLEPLTDLFISKPCLQTQFFEMVAKHVQSGSVYERLNPGAQAKPAARDGELEFRSGRWCSGREPLRVKRKPGSSLWYPTSREKQRDAPNFLYAALDKTPCAPFFRKGA